MNSNIQLKTNPNILLDHDGKLIYHRDFISKNQAENIFQNLLTEVNWQADVIKIFGKTIITKRKVAFQGDAGIHYTYSGNRKNADLWTPEVRNLKNSIENITGSHFNSCLLNLYHDGTEAMGWHSDDEKEMTPRACIASVSLGAERTMAFRHKHKTASLNFQLETGSLLLMEGEIQEYWQHRLPVRKKVLQPRINLTFRSIILQP